MSKDKQKYYAYLHSQQWKDKRKVALEFYGNNCGMCGSKYSLEVHHRNYKTIFKERIEDLMILCETCHRKFHKNKINKNGKKSKYMRDPNYETAPVTYYPKRTQK